MNDDLYGKEKVKSFFIGDLTKGYPEIASDSYDVVVCEQVLEHLSELNIAMKTPNECLSREARQLLACQFFPPVDSPYSTIRSAYLG